MRIFVTGGTGAIGRDAVPALVRAGHTVAALARSDVAADELRCQGANPVEVSIFDRDGLTAAFTGCDVVINLASALPLTSLTRSLRVSNASFRSATSWRPRFPSAREGYVATAAG